VKGRDRTSITVMTRRDREAFPSGWIAKRVRQDGSRSVSEERIARACRSETWGIVEDAIAPSLQFRTRPWVLAEVQLHQCSILAQQLDEIGW